MRSTHTYALLEVSAKAYQEIYAKLKEAGYDHAFQDGVIDMQGIAVSTPKQAGPQQVTCRSCKSEITLNPDSMEARDAGTDPLRQLQQHLRECSLTNAFALGLQLAPVVNMMAFESVEQPDRWRDAIANVVDYFLKQPGATTL